MGGADPHHRQVDLVGDLQHGLEDWEFLDLPTPGIDEADLHIAVARDLEARRRG